MATPLTDAINALTTYANSVTGASDTTLSDAVDTLAAGYGGGGSGVSVSRYEFTSTGANTQNIPINESSSDILFVYYYDPDSTFPTNNTIYEGWRIGPGLAYVPQSGTQNTNTNLRTNASGTTGLYNYGNAMPFEMDGVFRLSLSPAFPSGHKGVLLIYHK